MTIIIIIIIIGRSMRHATFFFVPIAKPREKQGQKKKGVKGVNYLSW